MAKQFMPVLTKGNFVERYGKGEFGNHSPTWSTLEAFLEGGYNIGPVHIRNRVANGPTWYDLEPVQVTTAWKQITKRIPERHLYISAMAPTEKTIIQGEAMQGQRNGVELLFTTVAKPMRDALKEWSKSVTGIEAYTLLRHFLCPNSFDWLETLFERYPEHVVEFSTYSTNWGTLDNFNTVFWEVRSY